MISANMTVEIENEPEHGHSVTRRSTELPKLRHFRREWEIRFWQSDFDLVMEKPLLGF